MGELAVTASQTTVRVVEHCRGRVSLILEVGGRDLVSIDGLLLDVAQMVIEADCQLSRLFSPGSTVDGGSGCRGEGSTSWVVGSPLSRNASL
jgi:hypothetical protein